VLGQGSTFWFTARFTIANPTSETVEQLEPQSAITEIRRTETGHLTEILVAEDNPVNQEVAVGLLAQLGYRVDVVADGHEALQALQKKDYDLIFMDCQMPGLDGYEATAEIRRLEQNRKHTKIVALTAYAATKEAIEKCLAAGMDDYLSKPFTKDSLANILAKHSEKKLSQVLDTKAKFGQHPLAEVLENETLRQLLEIESGSDKNFVKETLSLYLNHAEKCLSEMKQAVAQQDFSALKRSAHSLKGSSGSVGATTIFNLCNEIEYCPETMENEEIKIGIQTLEREFESLKQSITEFQKKDESPN
jgi:CheY-like chemotaxis protein